MWYFSFWYSSDVVVLVINVPCIDMGSLSLRHWGQTYFLCQTFVRQLWLLWNLNICFLEELDIEHDHSSVWMSDSPATNFKSVDTKLISEQLYISWNKSFSHFKNLIFLPEKQTNLKSQAEWSWIPTQIYRTYRSHLRFPANWFPWGRFSYSVH